MGLLQDLAHLLGGGKSAPAKAAPQPSLLSSLAQQPNFTFQGTGKAATPGHSNWQFLGSHSPTPTPQIIGNGAQPSYSIYSSNPGWGAGQRWMENDNAGAPGGGPAMHIMLNGNRATPVLDTQGPVAPNLTNNPMLALPQYMNSNRALARIQG